MPRIALLGCGLWGKNILRTLLGLGASVDVIDTNRWRREEAIAQGANGAFDSLDDRTDPDGIIIASPATTHADVIAEVLPLGKPVFVEKPFTTEVGSAERLADAGRGRLFVMDIWRYHPGVAVLSEIVRSNELGPVEILRSTRTNWTSPRKDTDAIWTLLPHDVAITLEVFGHIPAIQSAFAERRQNAVVGALVTLGDGPRVIAEVSTRYADKRREIRLHCRDGVAVLNALKGSEIDIYREKDDGEPACTTRRFERKEALELELKAFLDHLQGGPAPKSSAEEAVMIVRTIASVRRLAGLDGS